MPIIPALERLRQEDCKFEGSSNLRYRPYPKKKKEKKLFPEGNSK
jgi:hypothetical protein